MEQTIGRYQLLEQLGEGGMAVVHKAYDPSIDRTLAIKFLREERCFDPDYRTRFLREAKAAGILSHANIATVFDVGEVDNRPYIVMELLDGEPLDEVMKSGEPLPVDKVITYGIQLAKALDYAHSKGIVHRDVKPSNIVRLKNSDTLKMMDFGIARMENREVTQQTQMGEVLGTPQYMSPEQVLGNPVDARTDLFSLGVVLYQMVTDKKPFDAETLGTLLFRIATEPPPSLEQLAPDVPASLRHVITKLLEKKPERRFQSGKELTTALIKILKEVEEQAARKDMPRIVPLRVKWTVLMALTVTATMVISSAVIYKKQQRALLERVVEYGSSLAKFIAVESAIPVLSEDWVSIELFVQDVVARQEFAYLELLDHTGIIRGSSAEERVGTTFAPPTETTLLPGRTDVQTSALVLPDGTEVLNFAAPILFQDRTIGHVHLGIPQAPFQQVARASITMMAVFMVVTLLAVMLVTYILGNLLATPIRATIQALDEIAGGNRHHRIETKRNDEFGYLFLRFNHMAESLQKEEVETREPARTPQQQPAAADPSNDGGGDG
ncbi:MAG: protein kinase [Deferrisomatales bacterium]|nr:protein kinase [Deferrisomatales bacterium]